MAAHSVLWTSPQPLWGRFDTSASNVHRAPDQARPALLRFASDAFMQQLIAMLESDPRRIGETIARPETWRAPPAEVGELPDPERLPRLARRIARLRTRAAPTTMLAATSATGAKTVNGVERTLPLKLYHPAHQRYYLVAAHLVCGVPGLPDHGVATGGREQVGFVLRRLLPESSASNAPRHEYAFVQDARGPHWQRVQPDGGLRDPHAHGVTGEEMLPLFPLGFSDDAGRARRLMAGLVPVGRREEYLGSRRYETASAPEDAAALPAPSNASGEAPTKKSARKEQLKLDVTEPWKALIRAMHKAAERIQGSTPPGDATLRLLTKRQSAKEANEGAQQQSWLILLDFADYLANHLPGVWQAIASTDASPSLPDTAQRRLFDWLNGGSSAPSSGWQLSSGSFASSMRQALREIARPAVRRELEGAQRTFVSSAFGSPPWPDVYLLLAGVRESGSQFRGGGAHETLDTLTSAATDSRDVEASPEATTAETDAARVDRLVQLVVAALDPDAETVAAPIPFAAQLRDALEGTAGDPGWFVIRCAYARWDCGPSEPGVLSARTQEFQLASFFDSDAPARPIRIALPIDTTPAGLRKHPKNAAFILSDALCGQVNRLKGLGFVDLVLSVLPWPLHKPLNIGADGLGPCKDDSSNLGMICSLSIPIITICALILLMMIVLVLDFVFKWIPWFIICFPLRALRAKESTS